MSFIDKNNLVLLVLCLACSLANAMYVDRTPQNQNHAIININVNVDDITNNLINYFNPQTSELNLNNVPLTIAGLKQIFPAIESFVNKFKVQRLMLENIQLAQVPNFVIGFTLKSSSLCYVSMLKNNFSQTINNPAYPQISQIAVGDTATNAQIVDVRSANAIIGNQEVITGLVDLISKIWKSIAPSIEQAIEEQNASANNSEFIQKTILIDDSIPPLVVIDKQKLPKTSCQRFKYLGYKFLFVLTGAGIALLPTLVTQYLLQDDVTCDLTQLTEMLQACNITQLF